MNSEFSYVVTPTKYAKIIWCLPVLVLLIAGGCKPPETTVECKTRIVNAVNERQSRFLVSRVNDIRLGEPDRVSPHVVPFDGDLFSLLSGRICAGISGTWNPKLQAVDYKIVGYSEGKDPSMLIGFGQPKSLLLTLKLRSRDADTRLNAIIGLAAIGPEALNAAMPKIMSMLSDESDHVSSAALHALGNIVTPHLRETFFSLMTSGDGCGVILYHNWHDGSVDEIGRWDSNDRYKAIAFGDLYAMAESGMFEQAGLRIRGLTTGEPDAIRQKEMLDRATLLMVYVTIQGERRFLCFDNYRAFPGMTASLARVIPKDMLLGERNDNKERV